MDDFEVVEVPHCLTYLLDGVGGRQFLQPRLLFYHLIKLSGRSQLQQQVNIVLIMEEPVKFDDIRVIQVHLNFELASELIKNSFLFNNILRNAFEGTDEPCRLMPA